MKIKKTLLVICDLVIAAANKAKKLLEKRKKLTFTHEFLVESLKKYISDEWELKVCEGLVRRCPKGSRLDLTNLMCHAAHRKVLPELLSELKGDYKNLFQWYSRVNPWRSEQKANMFVPRTSTICENI